jgi:hypothetical protein
MPYFRIDQWRMGFFSKDLEERPHVHVERDRRKAKFWLSPISLHKNQGFRADELSKIARAIQDNYEEIWRRWERHREQR